VVQSLAVEDLQLFEQLEAGIVIIDGAGVVVRWNAHARRTLAVAADRAEVRAAAMQPGVWHDWTQIR
jgi:sensor histidine kinase regulating citrate/malate metabolism